VSSEKEAPKDKKASYKLFEQYLRSISGSNVVVFDDGSTSTPTCTGFPSILDESTSTTADSEVKGLGQAIGKVRGRRYLRRVQMDPNAFDGDEDGLVQDGTSAERPAPRGLAKIRGLVAMRKEGVRKRAKSEQNNLDDLFDRIKTPDGGFTFSTATNSHVKTGWAVARNGNGIAVPISQIFDADGRPTEEGKNITLAFILMQSDKLFVKQEDDKKVVLGGWHNPEDGMFYLDVTDVYSKDSTTVEEAIALGGKQKQISIGDLDNLNASLADKDWSRTTTHPSGGDGGDIIPLENLDRYLDYIKKNSNKSKKDGPQFEIVRSDDGVDMLIGDPVESLAAFHGEKKEWADIRAIPEETRNSIADFYDEAPDVTAEEMQEETRKAYEALAVELEEQYRILTEELGIEIIFTDDDPYENFEEMARDFAANKRLKILKTESTGGHPFFTNEQNDMFRAVHDAFGHLGTGRGFDRHGEEAAFQAHRSMFSALAAAAAATELRGQNSFLIARGEFGPQKLVLLPDKWQKSLARFLLLATKAAGKVVGKGAQRSSDMDNAYDKTGSHHVSCGRAFKN
jgi:hypothetical protein